MLQSAESDTEIARRHSAAAQVVAPPGLRTVIDRSSAEYRFILACLVRLVGDEDPEAPWDVRLEDLDWQQVVRLAAEHGALALLYREVTRSGIEEKVDPGALEHLRRVHVMQAASYLANRRLVQEVVGALAASGIESIPLKGASVAERLYRPPALRRIGDVDLLVRPDQFERAIRALAAAGFRYKGEIPDPFEPGPDYAYHFTVVRADPAPIHVEVHWLLNDDEVFNNPSSALNTGEVWERSSPDPSIEGARRLQPEDELLYLCAHAMKHRWRALYVLVDIALFVQRVPLDWVKVQEYHRAMAHTWTLEASLILCSALLALPLPAPVAEDLEEQWHRQPRLRRLVQSVIETWILAEPASGATDEFQPWRRYLAIQSTFAQTQRTAGGHAIYWLRQLTTPDVRDRELLDVGPSLSWIYRFTRPARLAAVHARYLVSRLRR